MNIEIADRLVRLRRESGLSQEDLAARLGVSRQAVSKWERAESSPDTDNLIAIARLYGVSLDELLLTGTGQSGGEAAASEAAPEPEPEPYTLSDDHAVLSAALEWEETEAKLTKAREKAFEKRMEKLNWPITLILMVVFPALSSWLGLGDLYPILVVIVYLVTGFLLDNWHPGWLLFLSVPIYEYLIHLF